MKASSFLFKKRDFFEFYCPLCKATKRTFYYPSPRKRHYFYLATTAAFLSICLWPWIGPKGFFWAFPLWGAFEAAYRLRARQSFICTKCGFDPYAFKFNVKLAKEKVVAHQAVLKAKEVQRASNRAALAKSQSEVMTPVSGPRVAKLQDREGL